MSLAIVPELLSRLILDWTGAYIDTSVSGLVRSEPRCVIALRPGKSFFRGTQSAVKTVREYERSLAPRSRHRAVPLGHPIADRKVSWPCGPQRGLSPRLRGWRQSLVMIVVADFCLTSSFWFA